MSARRAAAARRNGVAARSVGVEIFATQVLGALRPQRARYPLVDDVVLGCVDPVGEAAATLPAPPRSTPITAMPCPACRSIVSVPPVSTLSTFAAAQVMAGQHDMTVGGGRRIDEPDRHRARPARPAGRSVDRAEILFSMPQGISADLIATKYGFTATKSTPTRFESQQRRRQGLARGTLQQRDPAVKDPNGLTILAKDEHMRRAPACIARAAAAFVRADGARWAGSMRWRWSHPEIEAVNHVHHAGNSVRHLSTAPPGAGRQARKPAQKPG